MDSLFVERRARDASISLAESNAQEWTDAAVEVIRALALTRREFTTDDVWSRVPLPQPREARAMGAAMRRAKAMGLIEKTGKYESTKRPGCHARPVPVWRGI